MVWHRQFRDLPNGTVLFFTETGSPVGICVKTGDRAILPANAPPNANAGRMTAVPDISFSCISVDRVFLNAQNAVA